ncbi:unnamed protein product [Paramecium octaurelia]|uniref:Ubiquitin-activating enzyme E1 C-terminal domain-containing protein n=1 Tax=Paramecium octaurelia TaxID=43137 RepID=A0A8S1VP84_PAROT|nr:unnamed protein product [Paramecium octaurelia]
MQQQETKFDENLYSRQVAVLGAETQSKLIQMKCFIHGLRGLGLEIAKNLILAGPKSVTVYDPTVLSIADLGSNFYASLEQVGKVSRQDAAIKQLKELNPYVSVEIYNGQLNGASLSEYTVVVLTDVWDQKFITEVNEAVRQKGHGFILAHSSGLFGSTFVDFSDKFQIFDPNGEEPKQAIVAGITNEAEGIVSTIEDKRHGFQDGDSVTFREVVGMTEVNEKIFKIKVKSPFMFSIGDTTNFSQYLREGIAVQVKVPEDIAFKSFNASLSHPFAPGKNELDLMDWEKIGRPEQLHISYNALLQFAQQNGRWPGLLNQEDAQKVWELAQQINNSDRGEGALKAELDEQLVKNTALYFSAQITPLTSFWGGIVAQEIVKYTGKFSPIRQWLHSEFFEALPETEVNRTLLNSQYDDYVAIFGREALHQLQNSKIFMVGAGALGCEYIKMFALMGCGSGASGQVTVTDDDNIEVSNLNRQFLFRKNNVGSNKAATACKVGEQMNKTSKFKSYALRVGQQNEPIFNDQFWDGLDIAINAVDNVHARKYIDNQCCYYGKPLFESGTLGTKCNSQLILPNQTQSYSESQDPPEDSIPLCTLKNFPYQIEHTIQWARDYFAGFFEDGSQDCIKYLENPENYLKKILNELKNQPGVLRPKLESVKKFAEVAKKPSLHSIVALTKNMFQDIFCNQIKQLLYCFPPDHKTSEGQLFWTNPKRPPTPIEFDQNDPLHQLFIHSAVNIFSQIFGLPKQDNFNEIAKILPSIQVQQYVPKQMQIKENEKDQKEEKSEDDETQIQALTQELEKLTLENKEVTKQLQECAFEKDDPTNWHIEFLSAVSNLRARNYRIPEVQPFQVKLIAGKIIPALATTTAMIVGAVGLEIFKYILKKNVTKMRNAFINLALPLFLFSEPLPPGEHLDQEYNILLLGPTKAIPEKWTAWDRITINQQMTLGQFIDYFKEKYQVTVSSITFDKYIIYNNYPQPPQENFNKDLSVLFVENAFQPLPAHRIYLDFQVSGELTINGNEINADFAPVKYQYKK